MKKLKCLRCGAQMTFLKREKLQLGQTGAFLGDLPNIIAGALEAEIYCCRRCGKLEFFAPDYPGTDADEPQTDTEELPPECAQNIVGVSMDGVPQVRCPRCGKRHDFDYPKCIYCDYDYYA